MRLILSVYQPRAVHRIPRCGLLLLALLCTAGNAVATAQDIVRSTAAVNQERLRQADEDSGNWLAHGRTYQEQRFSPLADINQHNVANLGLAWSFDTDSRRGLEATPIVVDGVIYSTGAWSVVYANDARSGRLLWKYDPRVPKEWGRFACCDVVNRGVALWEGKVFVGTLDGRLVALNAATGATIWETLTIDPKQPYTITGAPRVARGKVFIGNGGADYGVRGYVSAYDTDTGELVWRFYTVPGDPAQGFENDAMRRAAETWNGEWWRYGGGGTVWDSMTYDPELNLLYIGTGNGAPWNPQLRSPGGGDNLYLSSIVALNADTGVYVWHFQENPAEAWDYTATQHIMLADMLIDSELRKVIWHAPKNGFFFVIDRTNGNLLSARPYVKVNWATHYDMATGRPVEHPEVRYYTSHQAALVMPSSIGAHNWQPMAYNPQTRLVYIPANETFFTYKESEPFVFREGFWNLGVDVSQVPPGSDPALGSSISNKQNRGFLIAWDPYQQREQWRVQQAQAWNGGVLATAGNLVFQGTADGWLVAYAADTGQRLWAYDAQSGIMAPPVTYRVDGEQYITVLAGKGGSFGLMAGIRPRAVPPASRILTFKLGGEARLPPLVSADIDDPPARITFNRDVIARGAKLYHTYCTQCHGANAVSGGGVPDLRRLAPAVHETFNDIVLEGTLTDKGMIGFADVLSEDDARAIHAFLVDRAYEDKNAREDPTWWRRAKTWFYEVIATVVTNYERGQYQSH